MQDSLDFGKSNIKIRRRLKPGDIGCITYLHGVLYAGEYGYNQLIESYVAAGLAEMVQSFRPDRDCIWAAEMNGRMVGSIAIVGRSDKTAQLRYFVIHPSCRGLGLGRALLGEAVRFCRESGYQTIFLWTASELTTAAHLYTSTGFAITEEKVHTPWGKTITEQRYEMRLTKE